MGPTVVGCLTVDCMVRGADVVVVYRVTMRKKSKRWWRCVGKRSESKTVARTRWRRGSGLARFLNKLPVPEDVDEARNKVGSSQPFHCHVSESESQPHKLPFRWCS